MIPECEMFANSCDDACRLVYADWIEEQGQAKRAQFIRRQVALERRATAPTIAERMDIAGECGGALAELQNMEDDGWTAEELAGFDPMPGRCFIATIVEGDFRSFAEKMDPVVHFHRGFISWVMVENFEEWISVADHLVPRAPVEAVMLRSLNAHGSSYMEPRWRNLRFYSAGDYWKAEPFRRRFA